jgi:heavy metal sensor kinase
MMPASIRARLTLWYAGSVAVTMAAYAAGILLATQASVDAVIDEGLRLRLLGAQALLERYDPSVSLAETQEEFAEHADVGTGGDLVQVAGKAGRWLFRPPSMARYGLPAPAPGRQLPAFETLTRAGVRLRVVSGEVALGGVIYTLQLAAPVADADAILDRLEWVLVASIPLVLGVASAGGYWISRRALAPVDAITLAAQSISEHNLSRRLASPDTGDELQRLTVTFNQMIERLEAAFTRITQFTADASHELRTPVAVVRTTAELSLRRQRDDPQYRDALVQILDEAKRMTAVIDSLMTLARVDSGVDAPRTEAGDVAALVRQACARSEPLARAKPVHLELGVDGPAMVKADAAMLERLFLSLIDNAIKYTPAGGRVSVGTRRDESWVVVTVRDTGIGIAAEDLPFVFDRFYRADKARSREAGGAGLGLSIARWIVEAHGGSISVESTVGQGSVFEVRLPPLSRSVLNETNVS